MDNPKIVVSVNSFVEHREKNLSGGIYETKESMYEFAQPKKTPLRPSLSLSSGAAQRTLVTGVEHVRLFTLR